jgi:hypothetical protein
MIDRQAFFPWILCALAGSVPIACGTATPAIQGAAEDAGAIDDATGGGSDAAPGRPPDASLGGDGAPEAADVPQREADAAAGETAASEGDRDEAGTCASPCGAGLACCAGSCVYTGNDLRNCGGCGIVCPASKPMCDEGHCAVPPCTSAGACAGGTCCGGACCAGAELCCSSVGGPTHSAPFCRDPVGETCPVPCLTCP